MYYRLPLGPHCIADLDLPLCNGLPKVAMSGAGLGTHGVPILKYRDFCKYLKVFVLYLLPETFQSTSIANTGLPQGSYLILIRMVTHLGYPNTPKIR